MTTLTSLKRPGDFVVHVENLAYCTKSVIVRNTHTAEITLTDPVAYPLVAGTSSADYNLAVAGEEASVIAMLMDRDTIAEAVMAATSNSGRWYQALIHPPCIINSDLIPALDAEGNAFTIATIVTALKALGWEVRTGPVKQTTL